MAGEELGKLTALKSSDLALTLKDKVSVNVKHTNTGVNVELFGVGVILWNTISLSNLLRLCSVCQYRENAPKRPTHAASGVSEPV